MTHKTILITRPLQDNAELTEALHERGHRVICEPMSEIFLHHTARAPLESALLTDPDAVITTSKNGVRALASLSELRDAALVCVGDATAAAALSMGFTRIFTAGMDVSALITYLTQAYDADAHFVYPSAAHVSNDLGELLSGHSMKVTRIIVYEAIAATAFSDTLSEQLKRGGLDMVTFFSQRAVDVFNALIETAGLQAARRNLHALCLSRAIAKRLDNNDWADIQHAAQPTLASLLDCVDNAP